MLKTRDVWFFALMHNNDDKVAYYANKEQVESLISLILGAGLDPDFMGRPYFTSENLKVQGVLHSEGYMTGLAMRIIEERELQKDNGSAKSL